MKDNIIIAMCIACHNVNTNSINKELSDKVDFQKLNTFCGEVLDDWRHEVLRNPRQDAGNVVCMRQRQDRCTPKVQRIRRAGLVVSSSASEFIVHGLNTSVK